MSGQPKNKISTNKKAFLRRCAAKIAEHRQEHVSTMAQVEMEEEDKDSPFQSLAQIVELRTLYLSNREETGRFFAEIALEKKNKLSERVDY